MNSSLRKKLSVLSCALITLVSVAPGGAQAKPNWEKFKEETKGMFSGQKLDPVRNLAKAEMQALSSMPETDDNKDSLAFWKARLKAVYNTTASAEDWPAKFPESDLWDEMVKLSQPVTNEQIKEKGIAAMIELGLIEEKKPNPNEIENGSEAVPDAQKPDEGQPAQPAANPAAAPKQPTPAKPVYNTPTRPTFSTPSSDPSTPAGKPGVSLVTKVLIGGTITLTTALTAWLIYAKAKKIGPFAPGNKTSLIKH